MFWFPYGGLRDHHQYSTRGIFYVCSERAGGNERHLLFLAQYGPNPHPTPSAAQGLKERHHPHPFPCMCRRTSTPKGEYIYIYIVNSIGVMCYSWPPLGQGKDLPICVRSYRKGKIVRLRTCPIRFTCIRIVLAKRVSAVQCYIIPLHIPAYIYIFGSRPPVRRLHCSCRLHSYYC